MSINHKHDWHLNSKEYLVNTVPIKYLLSNITYIDIFSIDVEGAELQILETMNWNIEIYIICIELSENDLIKEEKCRQLLRQKGFIKKLRMGINEFWINPFYSRINKLYNPYNSKIYNNILEYGNHMFIEPGLIEEINHKIINYNL